MNRKSRVDAIFGSVRAIEDPDAFQLVIAAEPDDYVLADLRDRFWDGLGAKPWQVTEINRLLTHRREQRKLTTAAPEGNHHVQVARITARQVIIVTVITAIAGLFGAAIQRQATSPTPATTSTAPAPQQHWLYITGINFESAPANTQFRLIAFVDGIPYSYPGQVVWAQAPATTRPAIFPLPAGLSKHDLLFEVYYRTGAEPIKHARGSPGTVQSVPHEGVYVIRDVVEGARTESRVSVQFAIRTNRD